MDIDYLATGQVWSREEALEIAWAKAFGPMIAGPPQLNTLVELALNECPSMSEEDYQWICAEGNRRIEAARNKMLDRGVRAMEKWTFFDRETAAHQWVNAWLRANRITMDLDKYRSMMSTWVNTLAWDFKPEGLGPEWLAVNVSGFRGYRAYLGCLHLEPEHSQITLDEFRIYRKGNHWHVSLRKEVARWEAKWN